jgi:hypothetical protein
MPPGVIDASDPTISPTGASFLPQYCYERTRDQGTLGSIAIAIVEPLGGRKTALR